MPSGEENQLKIKLNFIILLMALLLLFTGCSIDSNTLSDLKSAYESYTSNDSINTTVNIDLDSIPAYSGSPYVILNNNIPYFTQDEITTESFEYYSELDSLGRVGTAYACVGIDLMPTEERGNISEVKPTGWHSSQYDFVNGKNLYNRCHLIAFMLAGENANNKNLMTGTRYLNVDGMLPFENQVANYVRNGGHVMYRVTPVFNGDDLVASGVELEGYSVEDNGQSVQFNVYCYNVQPGVAINYANGDNWAENQTQTEVESANYIINTNSGKFHLSTCSSAQNISEKNRQEYSGSREDLLLNYQPCQICNP